MIIIEYAVITNMMKKYFHNCLELTFLYTPWVTKVQAYCIVLRLLQELCLLRRQYLQS